MADKKVIKAREVEESGANVERIEYSDRRFGDRVYKDISLDEQPVAMEDQAELPEPDYSSVADSESGQDEHGTSLERFYNDDGELTGLKITCRCGEEIELEFTREEDEIPSGEAETGDTVEPQPQQPQAVEQDIQPPADSPEPAEPEMETGEPEAGEERED